MIDWVFIVGGSVFAVTVRVAGLLLGRFYPCPAMTRYRLIVGTALYALAVLSMIAGVAGL